MKVLQPTALLTLTCSTDKGFKPPKANGPNGAAEANGTTTANATHGSETKDPKFQKIKTAANFGKSGAKIDMCSSGDCTTGQMITLAMSRLEETDATNTVILKAENFNKADGDWGEFTDATFNNVSAMSTSYVATSSVKDKGDVVFSPAFNLTASIYSANGTTMNGNQSVAVPAGVLKFTVALSGWTFKNTANRLRFAITVKAKAKSKSKSSASTTANTTTDATADATTDTTTTTTTDLPQPEKKKKNGTESKIDRLDFDEGMFMDAPAIAVIDGVDVNGANTEYVWVFPSFTKTLYYDPVIGSSDVSAQMASDTSGSTTGTTTTNANGTATDTNTTTTTTATNPTTTNTTTPIPSTTTSGASSTRAAAELLFSSLVGIAAYALI